MKFEATPGEPVQICVTKCDKDWRAECLQVLENMVELVGIEPTTSSLRTMRSPS